MNFLSYGTQGEQYLTTWECAVRYRSPWQNWPNMVLIAFNFGLHSISQHRGHLGTILSYQDFILSEDVLSHVYIFDYQNFYLRSYEYVNRNNVDHNRLHRDWLKYSLSVSRLSF